MKYSLRSPVDADNRATHECCCWLSKDLASTLVLDMANPTKVTMELVTKLNGKRCKKNTTAAQKKAGYGIRANNDPAEQNFAVFDDALGQMGRVAWIGQVARAWPDSIMIMHVPVHI